LQNFMKLNLFRFLNLIKEIFLLEKNEYDRNQNLSKLFNYPTTSPDKVNREDSNSDKRSMASSKCKNFN
jgi:hypothetical protein